MSPANLMVWALATAASLVIVCVGLGLGVSIALALIGNVAAGLRRPR